MKHLRVNPGIRNRTPAEQAIIYAATLNGAPVEALLAQVGARPMNRNRTRAERAIIFVAVLNGASIEEIDALLAQVGARPMNPNSYVDLVKLYAPYFREDITRIKYAIEHPPTRAEVKAGQISYIFRRAA